jgi:hypothetical protein
MKIKTQLKIKGKQVKVQVKNRRKQLSPTRSTDARFVTGVSSPTAKPTIPKPTPAVAEATTSTITETTTAAATTAAAPTERKARLNRPCDKRQRTCHRITSLFVKCGLGTEFRTALNLDGHKAMGQRDREGHVLRFLFGKTFDSKSYYWLENPDTNLFIVNMLHLASAGKVSKDADLSGLFFQAPNCVRNNNRVQTNTDVLEAVEFPLAELGKALRQWCTAAGRGASVYVPSPVA